MGYSFGKIKNVLFFGGGQLLFDVASGLAKSGYPARVVTSRRHALSSVHTASGATDFLGALKAAKIVAWVTADIESDKAIFESITPNTLGVSLGAEWIFKTPFIDRFGGRLVNLHGSRLPRTRGGGGVTWLILNNERNNGSCIHLVDSGIDTGAIVAFSDYTIPESCRTVADYQSVALRENHKLLQGFLRDVEAGREFDLIPQQEHLSTYWPRLNTQLQGFIDWRWSLEELERFIRAFDDPYPGASTFVNGRRVYLKSCSITAEDGAFHPFHSGLIYRKTSDAIFIAASGGTLVIRSVHDEDGHACEKKLRLGDRFFTPNDVLENAMQHRAVYRAQEL